jgi:hypothetical protein
MDCEKCNITFKTKGNLTRHLKTYHSGKQYFFKCKNCLKEEVFNKPFYKKYCSYECRSFQQKNPKFNVDFLTKWSNDMAYIIGFIAADGYIINDYDKRMFRVSIEIKRSDECILKYFCDNIKYTGKITNRDRLDKRTQKTYKTSTLNLYSIKFIKFLDNIGLKQCKSLTMDFPIIPEPYISHFIRGYYDGDGCCCKKNLIDFRGTKPFLEKLKLYIENNLDIKLNNKISFDSNIYRLSITSSANSLSILKWLYNNSCQKTRLERKYLIYEEILKKNDIGLRIKFNKEEISYIKSLETSLKLMDICKLFEEKFNKSITFQYISKLRKHRRN